MLWNIILKRTYNISNIDKQTTDITGIQHTETVDTEAVVSAYGTNNSLTLSMVHILKVDILEKVNNIVAVLF